MAEKKTTKYPEITELLKIESNKAGSPTQDNVYWISLKPCEVSKLFYEKHQIQVSYGLLKRLLRELGYGYRKQSKQLATGSYSRRETNVEIARRNKFGENN